MTDLQEKEIATLIEENKIKRILYLFCRATDRCDTELLSTLYHEDALHIHGHYNGPASGFIAAVKSIYARMDSATHHLTNILIDIDGDVAHSESNSLVICARDQGEGGERIDLVLSVRFLDRFEKRNGQWKIAKRRVVYDTNQSLPPTTRWDGEYYGAFGNLRGTANRSDPLYVD